MAQRSKSTLFLIEQLIVIAVFAICAAACISIFTAAYFYTNDSVAAGNAVIKAESAAEIFKATGGDHVAVAEILSGSSGVSGDAASVMLFFDSDWQICGSYEASYLLKLSIDSNDRVHPGFSLISGTLTVEKITGEQLVSFPLTARTLAGVEAVNDE